MCVKDKMSNVIWIWMNGMISLENQIAVIVIEIFGGS